MIFCSPSSAAHRRDIFPSAAATGASETRRWGTTSGPPNSPHTSRLAALYGRLRPFCPNVVVGAFAATLLLSACNPSEEQKTAPAQSSSPQVSVIVLHPGSTTITAELPGRVAASLVAEVRPQVGGIIRARGFDEGSEVKEGDVLYEIDSASYKATYDVAAAALQKAEAKVPSAKAKVERYEGLVAQNAVSKQDVDDARSDLLQAQADVASAKADLESARINLDHTKVKAPISGRISASAVTVGALVTADQETALTTIRTLDPINIDVTQSSTNLLRLRRAVEEGRIKTSGKNVAVKLKLDDGSTYAQDGTLEFMESVIDETTGTFTVRAVFPNPDRLLLPGMYVRGILEEGVSEGSFLVPQRAVTHNPDGEAVAFFVEADGKVDQRVLSVQRSVGSNWLVDGGVSDGDRLIVEGAQSVKDGDSVRATEVSIDEETGEVQALSKTPPEKASLSNERAQKG
ncbi:efflux RND transporter periplasmic adaptor subunit [Afifella marina DSM 2698]|nr:efflux RND transporter periplasmic adaptor subunit [Afifella marina DSM 2698]MBK1628038.1 efflux RND transporter periplasmic adaptor subunit [Afifella marina]MBK5918232.1 efflux transporter periplasmic adaptor subunit [Afifella marina]RAI19269.1 efflux transporter periplasmic adaptor subunit [Afifella marina DSM 2698]